KNSPISGQLNTLLSRMVQMEMARRPASMAVVKKELQRLLAQQTAKKLSPPVQKVIRARIGRRNFLLGLASVIGVCGGSIAITAYDYLHPNLFGAPSIHPILGDNPVSSPATPAAYPGNTRILSQSLYTYRGHIGTVTAVAWSPDGQHIASAGMLDCSVQVWEASTGSIMAIPALISDAMGQQFPTRRTIPAVFALGKLQVDTLAWSPDSTCIASAYNNDSVDIWNIITGDETLLDFSQSGTSNALAWSPDGTHIAAVSGNSNIKIRSVATGAFILGYEGHTQAVHAIAWSPDGKQILSGGDDGMVLIWDASTGITLVKKIGFAEIQALTWSPDGRQIAVGGSDGTVQVYDSKGNPLFTYSSHTGNINALAWQPGSRLLPGHPARIASAGDDSTVQIWSFGRAGNSKQLSAMALQGEILIYQGHSGPVTSIMWAADGQRIVSGSADGTVQIWRAM
ncbi:MAG TPA: WD40 repeat domain-containing protein, partial [Ktedonobacteraceae bacterium]|nr:WD40 repeat domain-containing protein [Ktedonobacteraceae bacterium]